MSTDLSEAELLGRASRGDSEAFRILVERNEERVLRIAGSIVRDPHEALDVAQEVFIALYRVLPRWEPRAALSTWLYRTTVNSALAQRRQMRRAAPPGPRPAGSPAPGPSDGEAQAAMARALARLPDRQQAALTLKLIEELSFSQIADMMQISVSSAKTHFARGLAALRAALRREGLA